ncbi:MAG: hypothetical protein AAGD34_09525 [Pseudomonadota bacterium]
MKGHLRTDEAPIALAERLGKGGEGEVFAVEGEPHKAVKLYAAEGACAREGKIAAMVAAELWRTAPTVAFPQAAVRDGEGRFKGFLMPRVDDAAALHELYAPGARKARFPDADYRFLVRVALNAARSVAATHLAGCVIGDVNHSSFLIGEDALVTLIDADSFQFHDGNTLHLCRVGVPEYTAPELFGVRLDDTARSPAHDAFGLAVVVFQLLFMGRHPFAGVSENGEIRVPEAIAAHQFAYSSARETGLAPPPDACRLTDVPEAIATLFERAFSPDPEERPSADAWVDALSDLEASLIACGDSLRHHHAKGVASCPWCRLEAGTGALLFLLPRQVLGEAFEGAEAAPFNAAALRERVGAFAISERFAYAPPEPIADPGAPPRRSPWPALLRIVGGTVMMGLAAVQAILIPQNWLLSAPAAIAGFVIARNALRRDRAAQQDLVFLDSRLSRLLLNKQAKADIDTPFILQAQVLAAIEERATRPVRFAEVERDFQAERAARRNGSAPGGAMSATDRTELARRLKGAGSMAAALDARIEEGMAMLSTAAAALEAARTERDEEIDTLLARRALLVAEIEKVGGKASSPPLPAARLVSPGVRDKAKAMAAAR